MNRARILITGGTGYIGSHTAVRLIEAGHEVCILDSLVTSRIEVLDAIATITGVRPAFHRMDVRDREAVQALAQAWRPDAAIHFAGLKAVGESVADPLRYHEVNVGGLIALAQALDAAGVRRIVFSSSATVYGTPVFLPYTEAHPTQPVNPYGATKLHAERVLADLCAGDASWRAVVLRYFNPVGAHPSGHLAERPVGVAQNLMPILCEVALGQRRHLMVHGGDYDTADGSCVRDYLHVMDLADAHLAALGALEAPGWQACNIGTGRGVSVFEMVRAFEAVIGRPLPLQVGPRRAGDLPAFWADASLAAQKLGWRAQRDIAQACEDAWRAAQMQSETI